MSRVGLSRPAAGVAAAVAATLTLAACGGSDDDSSAAKATGAAPAAATDVSAAKAAVAAYIGKPSAFPVTEPLEKRPNGQTMAFMDTGTPIGAVLWQLFEPAAKTLGMKPKRYKAGPAQNTLTDGFDAAVADKPGAVFSGAQDPARWPQQLKAFRAMGAKVVGTGLANGEQYGLEPVNGGVADMTRSGTLMADYVVAHLDAKADVVLYDVAELPFTKIIAKSFATELKRVCSSCQLRQKSVAAATIGNTAPNTIVSDLQSKPKTTVAVFTSDEVQHGLPEALAKAGIKVKTLGYAPDPANLQYLKEGKETAVLATDLAVAVWSVADQAARDLAGQKLTGPQAKGYNVVQFLRPEDVTFDPSRGWTGYPDFAQRFAKLWGGGAGA